MIDYENFLRKVKLFEVKNNILYLKCMIKYELRSVDDSSVYCICLFCIVYSRWIEWNESFNEIGNLLNLFVWN